MSHAIFIENLHSSIDVAQLLPLFKIFGRIISANIEVDKHLVSSCQAYIYFDNLKSAKEASTEMNGKKVMGKLISVKTEFNEDAKKNLENYTRVFIKNFNTEWDEADLLRAFMRFGEISKAEISETNGKSNGYGFVQFYNNSSAKSAVEIFHNQIVSGKKLIVQPFVPKDLRDNQKPNSLDAAKDRAEKSAQLNNLHVKNLPEDMTENRLRELFQEFGEIVSLKVERDWKTQKCRGYGFVCFTNAKDAEKALNKKNNTSYCSQILEVNFNQKKAARKQYLQMINSDNEVRRFNDGREMVSGNLKKNAIFSFSAKNK